MTANFVVVPLVRRLPLPLFPLQPESRSSNEWRLRPGKLWNTSGDSSIITERRRAVWPRTSANHTATPPIGQPVWSTPDAFQIYSAAVTRRRPSGNEAVPNAEDVIPFCSDASRCVCHSLRRLCRLPRTTFCLDGRDRFCVLMSAAVQAPTEEQPRPFSGSYFFGHQLHSGGRSAPSSASIV